jgi:hypothetical protein
MIDRAVRRSIGLGNANPGRKRSLRAAEIDRHIRVRRSKLCLLYRAGCDGEICSVPAIGDTAIPHLQKRS